MLPMCSSPRVVDEVGAIDRAVVITDEGHWFQYRSPTPMSRSKSSITVYQGICSQPIFSFSRRMFSWLPRGSMGEGHPGH